MIDHGRINSLFEGYNAQYRAIVDPEDRSRQMTAADLGLAMDSNTASYLIRCGYVTDAPYCFWLGADNGRRLRDG